nr:cellulose synthase complex outer membrane protein BcsC [Plesiomonas shigelloides]
MSGIKPLLYSLLAVSLTPALLTSPPVLAAQQAASPTQWLLSQVALGEATNRDDLVQDSLERLRKIAPNNPEVLAAQLRFELRQNQTEQAAATLERLRALAPQSEAYQQSQRAYALVQPQGKAQLQQARLFARAGRYQQAIELYDKLLDGAFPTPQLALEYWQVKSQLPDSQAQARQAIAKLSRQNPDNGQLALAYARQLFSEQADSEAGFALLTRLSNDAQERNNAGQLWYDQLQRLPVSNQTAALWQRYLQLYPNASAEAHSAYQTLQATLSNPAFQAKQRANQKMAANSQDYAQIEQELRRALQGYPNDPELLGELGRLRLRQSRHNEALALFEQAQKNDPSADDAAKWTALINTARYWGLIQTGDQALEKGQWAQAEQAYRTALPIEPADPYASLGLADLAAKRGQITQADRAYQEIQRRFPDNDSALRKRITLQLEKNPQQAKALIAGLSPAQRKLFASDLQQIEADRLQKEAEKLQQQAETLQQEAETLSGQNQLAQAESKLARAQKIRPDDIWLTYRLAKLRAQLGQPQPEATFAPLLKRTPRNPDLIYAYSLFLAGQGQEQAAVRQLRSIPEKQWDNRMQELAARLEFGAVMDNARAMKNRGQDKTAIAYLQMQQKTYPTQAAIPLTLGDWAQQAGQWDSARRYYAQALLLEPKNADARLSLIELDLAQGKTAQARTALTQLEADPARGTAQTPELQRRRAVLWAELGEPEKAKTQLRPLLTAQASDPRLFRDAARLERQTGNPQQAKQDYRRAMQLAKLGDGQDDVAYTQQTRVNAKDDWLQRSIRSDAESLYRQQDPTVTLEYDRWGSNGTAGTSDLTAGNVMLETAIPLQDGRLFFRVDQVHMDAGRIDLSNLRDASDFGSALLCAPTQKNPDQRCQYGSEQQTANGTALAVGWRGERWEGDLGVTPLGFEVTDWVGGIRTEGDLGKLGWSAVLSRRPLSNSLLAYAGTVDPNTGQVWGGVRATGVKLGLSADQGGAYGAWSSLQYHQLTGENVEDNTRLRVMGGVYHRVIDEPHRRLRVGTNAMYWTFDKDLSGYTFGQGGYYSPQRYVSLSLPVSYSQRWQDWSLHMEASVGYSWPKSDGGPYYPTRPDLQREAVNRSGDTFINPIYGPGGEPGFGYRARMLVEHRLTPNWFVGAAFDLEKSDTYTPNHALVYLRYSFDGWSGDLLLPPEPLVPYADFD